jgi:hypothetical protein
VTPAAIAVERPPFRAEIPEKRRVSAPLALTTGRRAPPNMGAEMGVKEGTGSGRRDAESWCNERLGSWPFGTVGRRGGGLLVERTEPDFELYHEVKVGVEGAAYCRVMSLALAVVLAPSHMDGNCAVEPGNAVSRMEVEP